MIAPGQRVVWSSWLPRRSFVGTVVHVHRNGEAFEVEFVTLTGATVAVATVPGDRLRPVPSSR